MQLQLSENLILSQVIKSPMFRDKVISHIQTRFFIEKDSQLLYPVLEQLVKVDKAKSLDRATILLKYKNTDFLDSVLSEDFPLENIPLLIKETEIWAQEAALREELMAAADTFEDKSQRKDWGIIGSRIREALAFSFDKHLGLNYKNDIERRFEYYNRLDEKISTGWDMLDYYTNGGLSKKTLTVGAGSSGLGKTLLGTNLAASLVQRGYRGVYLTLELAEELISRRMDSVITKIPYYSIPKELQRVQDKLATLKGNIWVREYAPSHASSQSIMSYIKELEIIKKEKFDFLVVDYIQLMKANYPRNVNSYEKFKEVAEELREIAVELNIPVITFSQVQRAGYNNSDMGLSNIADSIGIVNTADLVIGMTQSPEEESENYQTWKIIKNRLGRKGVSFKMQMDQEILSFNQILNDEERLKLVDFRDRMAVTNVRPVVTDDHEVTVEEEVNAFKEFNDTIKDNKFAGIS